MARLVSRNNCLACVSLALLRYSLSLMPAVLEKNDLIRKARKERDEIEAIRAALVEGENSGYSGRTPEDIKKTVIKRLQKNGQLLLE